MDRKSRRQLYLTTAAQKRWSTEIHSLSDDYFFFMNVSTDDELSLNDSNFKQNVKITDIADIYEICKTYYIMRYLSAPMYLTLG